MNSGAFSFLRLDRAAFGSVADSGRTSSADRLFPALPPQPGSDVYSRCEPATAPLDFKRLHRQAPSVMRLSEGVLRGVPEGSGETIPPYSCTQGAN